MPFLNRFINRDHIRMTTHLRHGYSVRGHKDEPHATSPDPDSDRTLLSPPFEWPSDLSLKAIGNAIAATQNLQLIVAPIPEGLCHREISGLTVVIGTTAHVYYDPGLSPLNREQTILHEYAHILHGDVRADSDATHLRSMFSDPIEHRAETTGMELLGSLHRRRELLRTGRDSELLAFLSGGQEDYSH